MCFRMMNGPLGGPFFIARKRKEERMEKKSFKEFEEWAAEGVKEYLPNKFKDCKPSFEVITKHSGCYNGMYMKTKGENISSVVNMDQFYSLYLGGTPDEDLLRDMARVITVMRPVGMRDSSSIILDYKQVKKNLFVRIVSKDVAAGSLKDYPTYETDEFLLTYNVRVRFTGDTYGSLTIDGDMMNRYGVTKETLHKDAMASSAKLFPACYDTCEEIIGRLAGDDAGKGTDHIPECIRKMIIVSDRYGKTGSAVLFYPDTLERISRKLDGDFFVLPYSELSTIAFPVRYEDCLEEYLRFICSTYDPNNDGIVLSHNLYRYDSASRQLSVAVQTV